MGLATIGQISLTPLQHYVEENGDLLVAEGGREVPFSIARVFTVRAHDGAVRGEHAHKHCAQFLIAVNGAIDVVCDDGTTQRAFRLDRVDVGLLLPPSIWATQTFRGAHSVLLVLCDRLYEAADYIRAYEPFLAWRKAGGEPG